MSRKIILIIFSVMALLILVLAMIIYFSQKKIKSCRDEIEMLADDNERLTDRVNQIMGELEIERKHNMELAKKLADISCMSIDDVLRQLQNDKNGIQGH
jgi:predicted Holliday junction resolvase-like endonuclease